MIRVSPWTVPALAAVFLPLTFLILGTRVVAAEPSPPRAVAPAASNVSRDPASATNRGTPLPAPRAQARAIPAAGKVSPSPIASNYWEVAVGMDVPSLEPQALQYAIFDQDPLPGFRADVKETLALNPHLENQKWFPRSVQVTSWNMEGFKDISGAMLFLLTKRPGHHVRYATHNSSGPAGKKWVVTKCVDLGGKLVCWCIPIEVKPGAKVTVTFTEKNALDLQTIYNEAMQAEPSAATNRR